MQARTTREPLVPSYVLTSISLLFLSPFRSTPPLSLFFSYPAILLTPVQSYLSSVSVPISDFYHSLSLYTVLFCSLFLSENFARSSVLRSFSLFRTRSSFFIPLPPSPSFLSFIPLVFSLPSSSTFLVSLLALLSFLLHLPQLLTYIFVTHFHYRSPPVPILNFSYHWSFPPSNALIPHFVGIPCLLCVSCRPPTVLFLFLSSSLSF